MARDMKRASIVIQGASRITETDENFVCATLDWWPHDKCNYDNCPWGYSSVINMVMHKKKTKRKGLISLVIKMFDLSNVFFQDLSRPLLAKAIQGLHIADIKVFVPLLVFLMSETCSYLFGICLSL